MSGYLHHFFAARSSLCVNFRLFFRESLSRPELPLQYATQEKIRKLHFGQIKLLSVMIYYDNDWILYVNMALNSGFKKLKLFQCTVKPVYSGYAILYSGQLLKLLARNGRDI